ncbi:MAG TPA: hypothetical protein VGG39_03165 [Polyangiaceae bacterium]
MQQRSRLRGRRRGAPRGVGAYGCHAPGDACYADGDCGAATPNAPNTSPYCAFAPETDQWSCSEGVCGG